MDYVEHIEYALEYIEENLKNEFSLADLAKAAGYSGYHTKTNALYRGKPLLFAK